MKLYRESAIRRLADKPAVKMLNLWKFLSEKVIGIPIEVMMGSRREHPKKKHYSGIRHTALLHKIKGKKTLVLWLDSLNKIDPVVISHEIGHWVLKLYGYRGLTYEYSENCEGENELNTMAHHPPLYALQRSIGHNPQHRADEKANSYIKALLNGKESKQKQFLINVVLHSADCIMNCSEKYRKKLEEILHKKHPQTLQLLEKILALAQLYYLRDPDQNLEFSKGVVQALELGNGWYEADEIEAMKLSEFPLEVKIDGFIE